VWLKILLVFHTYGRWEEFKIKTREGWLGLQSQTQLIGRKMYRMLLVYCPLMAKWYSKIQILPLC
jgi:hypothetical protein